jgi:hypothetical protein
MENAKRKIEKNASVRQQPGPWFDRKTGHGRANPEICQRISLVFGPGAGMPF